MAPRPTSVVGPVPGLFAAASLGSKNVMVPPRERLARRWRLDPGRPLGDYQGMPRYVIERTYTVDESEVPTVATRSKRLVRDHFPLIVWEHSHVVLDTDGTPKSFCVYDAPSEEVVREHAERLGDHNVNVIYEIVGDVTPDDFPLTPEPA